MKRKEKMSEDTTEQSINNDNFATDLCGESSLRKKGDEGPERRGPLGSHSARGTLGGWFADEPKGMRKAGTKRLNTGMKRSSTRKITSSTTEKCIRKRQR